jgi:hypothetical protein
MLDKVGLFAGINGVRFCEIAPERIGEFLGENYKQRSFQLLVFSTPAKKIGKILGFIRFGYLDL